MKEKIRVYDLNMRELDISPVERDIAHREGLWHKVFDCWIIKPGSPNKILLQKRGSDKKEFPNLFGTSAAGHLNYNETIEDGIRELHEELGTVDVTYEDLQYVGIYKLMIESSSMKDHEFCYTYFYKSDRELSTYDLQPEEVDGLFEMAIPDILALFSNEVKDIVAKGVVRQSDDYLFEEMRVTKNDFMPYGAEYMRTICIMAERFINGERYLSI
jgi:isopentenyldiphosphate isomerase